MTRVVNLAIGALLVLGCSPESPPPTAATGDGHPPPPAVAEDESLALLLSAFTGVPTSAEELRRMGPELVYHSLMIVQTGDENSMAQALTDLTGTPTSAEEVGRMGSRRVFGLLWDHLEDAGGQRLANLRNWRRTLRIAARGDASMARELSDFTGTPTSAEEVRRMGSRRVFLLLWSHFNEIDRKRLAASSSDECKGEPKIAPEAAFTRLAKIPREFDVPYIFFHMDAEHKSNIDARHTVTSEVYTFDLAKSKTFNARQTSSWDRTCLTRHAPPHGWCT